MGLKRGEREREEEHVTVYIYSVLGNDINFTICRYVGADIVPGLIEANRARFANSSHLQFLVSDFVRQVPHKVVSFGVCSSLSEEH